MRVKTLLVITVGLAIVLLDVNLLGYDVLPDIIGLGMLFFCAVLMTDRAGRFVRTAVVAAIMLFLEVVRLFNLAEAAPAVNFFSLLYLFLTVLLVITAADGIGQFSQLQGHEAIDRMCDITGHIYALAFVITVMAMWFESLSAVFMLADLIITVFVLVMFTYFYSAIYVAIQQPFDPPPEISDGEAEEETIGAGEETVGAGEPI